MGESEPQSDVPSDFQPMAWPLLGTAAVGLLRRMDIF